MITLLRIDCINRELYSAVVERDGRVIEYKFKIDRRAEEDLGIIAVQAPESFYDDFEDYEEERKVCKAITGSIIELQAGKEVRMPIVISPK